MTTLTSGYVPPERREKILESMALGVWGHPPREVIEIILDACADRSFTAEERWDAWIDLEVAVAIRDETHPADGDFSMWEHRASDALTLLAKGRQRATHTG